MSLDITLTAPIFEVNITHNLGEMAQEAGLYGVMWHPPHGAYAKDLLPLLEQGLDVLESDPERFRKLNPENGWGSYEGLVGTVRKYIEACRESPRATVSVCR